MLVFSVKMPQENRIDLGGTVRELKKKRKKKRKSFPVVVEIKPIDLWFKSVAVPLVFVL